MSGMRGKIIAFVVVVAAGAGGYAYVQYREAHEPEKGDLVLYGNVDIREADLAFNVGGRIGSALVDEGDKVTKGQLLATLDPSTYDAEVAAAKARVAAQQATLDRLLAGSRTEEIRKARADVAAIQVSLKNAKDTLVRTQDLARNNYTPQQRLDDDRARVDTLEAQLKAAEQTLSLTIQGPREEDIAAARAQLTAEQAALDLALRKRDYTELHAPEDGVVQTRIMEPGSVVLPQSPVYSIALSNPVWVRTYVSEENLGRVHPGMRAKVMTDTAPGKPYDGSIGFISPVAEFTPKTVETPEVRTSLVYRLRVIVQNPDNGLRQGMPVTVKLVPDATGAKR